MMHGNCRLCSKEAALHRSHVFPAGLYKRFVSSMDKGGSFLSLKEGRISNRQFVGFWFCTDCEARLKQGEDAYYRFLAARPASSMYDSWIYYFAVSISWRCSLFYFDDFPGIDWVDSAMACWRSYLLGELSNAEPYSQLLVSLESPSWQPWNQGLGGFAMPNLNLVLSLVGPFVIFGISRPTELSKTDNTLLDAGRLLPNGGQAFIHPTAIESLVGVDSVRVAMNFLTEASTLRMKDMEKNMRRRGRR